MKIVIGIPTYDKRVDVEIMSTMNRLPFRYLEYDFGLDFITSSIITHARNHLCRRALEAEADWLYFWDSDVVINDLSFLEKLLETSKRLDALVVGGVYRLKRPGAHLYAAGMVENGEVKNFTAADLKEPRLCDVLATGSMLIHRSVLEKMGDPWFSIIDKPGGVLPEDFNFCLRAKEMGFKVAADPRFQTRHYGIAFWEHSPTTNQTPNA